MVYSTYAHQRHELLDKINVLHARMEAVSNQLTEASKELIVEPYALVSNAEFVPIYLRTKLIPEMEKVLEIEDDYTEEQLNLFQERTSQCCALVESISSEFRNVRVFDGEIDSKQNEQTLEMFLRYYSKGIHGLIE